MRSSTKVQRDLQPVMRLGKAAAQCDIQAKAYGACMFRSYENIEKDMCAKEFAAFKQCVQTKFGRKW
ncbi:hypothetical protein K437DRAFT_244276 [Tilletiaria anomala UBC 951]|uniref:CHCH domain-containing protein n=1 Tax=Tilletiaria anomala (strain ATCC 24038 / CBS 436.72 / UBC 951) TaxID=1037660 RepID=A0A066WHT3_TILAU|nr:uncharacterized protein K437DRAFT_244276 [Tilletiaria anomala UBC 951]KDN52093.1 hypothetical protein K437DRAFT_244276 [Tilletiaria anomala UBC 951]